MLPVLRMTRRTRLILPCAIAIGLIVVIVLRHAATNSQRVYAELRRSVEVTAYNKNRIINAIVYNVGKFPPDMTVEDLRIFLVQNNFEGNDTILMDGYEVPFRFEYKDAEGIRYIEVRSSGRDKVFGSTDDLAERFPMIPAGQVSPDRFSQ